MKFFAWEQAKRLLYEPDVPVPMVRKLGAGAIAGVVSQTAIFPFEVLKVGRAKCVF